MTSEVGLCFLQFGVTLGFRELESLSVLDVTGSKWASEVPRVNPLCKSFGHELPEEDREFMLSPFRGPSVFAVEYFLGSLACPSSDALGVI